MILLYFASTALLVGAAVILVDILGERRPALRVLLVATFVYLQIALVGRILSITGHLGNWTAWLFIDIICLSGLWDFRRWYFRSKGQPAKESAIRGWDRKRFKQGWTDPLMSIGLPLILFGFVVGAVVLMLLVASLIIPQNIDDTLSAYLPRLGYWIQSDSLQHLDSSAYNSVQSSYPLNASLPPLRTIVFLGNDTLVGINQWMCGLLSGLALYGLARSVGGNRQVSFYLAGIWLLTPSVAIQLGISLLDLFPIFFVLTALLFAYRGWTEGCMSLKIASSVALSLAVGSKHTVLFIAPALVVMGLVLFLRSSSRRREFLTWVGATVPIMLLLGLDRYLGNWRFYGHPLGDPNSFVLFTSTAEPTVAERFTYAIGNIQRTVVNLLFNDLGFLPNRLTESVISRFQRYEPLLAAGNISVDWGVPWLGIVTTLIIIIGISLAMFGLFINRSHRQLGISITLLPAVVFLAVLFLIRPAFSLSFSRYIMLPAALMLAASAKGLTDLMRMPRVVRLLKVASLVSVLVIVTQTGWVLAQNGIRPLTGTHNSWNNSDLEMLDLSNGFGNRATHQAVIRFLDDCISDGNVGMHYGEKFPHQLLFGSNYSRTVTQHTGSLEPLGQRLSSGDLSVLVTDVYSAKTLDELSHLSSNDDNAFAYISFGQIVLLVRNEDRSTYCMTQIQKSTITSAAANAGFFDSIPQGAVVVPDSLLHRSELSLFESMGLGVLPEFPSDPRPCTDNQLCTSIDEPIYLLRRLYESTNPTLLLVPAGRDLGNPGNPLVFLNAAKLFSASNSPMTCDMETLASGTSIGLDGLWKSQSCVGEAALLSTYELLLQHGCVAELKGWYVCN